MNVPHREGERAVSLKAFHVVFICISTLLAVGMAFWMIRDYLAGGRVESLLMGCGSAAAAIGLILYGRWFLRKMNKVVCL